MGAKNTQDSSISDFSNNLNMAQRAVGLLFFALFAGGGLLGGIFLGGNAGSISAIIMAFVGFVSGSILAVTLYLSIIINLAYEKAVVYRLGNFSRVIGSGLTYKIPYFEWAEKIDTRVTSENVTPQKVMTADSVPVTVDAIVYYRVKKEKEAVKNSILEVDNYHEVTKRYAQTKLRTLIGEHELDTILHDRKKVAEKLEKELDESTDDFGVHVRDVEIQDIEIPDSMQQSMAAEAESERQRRAKVRNAKGEVESAVGLRTAADILGEGGLHLRSLETLDTVASDNSTIIPLPLNMLSSISDISNKDEVSELVDNVVDNIDTEEYTGLAESINDNISTKSMTSNNNESDKNTKDEETTKS